MLISRSLNCISLTNKVIGSFRAASTLTKRDFKEVTIKVPWGHIAGKWWEPYNSRPILTIHGWQDNCGSFDRLIPMLNRNTGFLAIDLPGHGYSSCFSDGMIYTNVHYLLTVKSISKYFDWPKLSLMGHSLGAVTSFIYSFLYPQEVDFLICLDSVKPVSSKKQYKYFGQSLENFFKYDSFYSSDKEPPSYTIEEITRLVSTAHSNSVLPECAKYLYERNIAPSTVYPGKYYFLRDARLKSGSLNIYGQKDIVKQAERITMPIFIAKANESSYYEEKENYYEVLNVIKKSSVDCDFNYVTGTHHVHLNHPENLSELINKFLVRHDIEDRRNAGIRDEIIVDDVRKIDIS